MERQEAFMKQFCWLFRCVLGCIFLTAGVMKIADPARFAEDIAHFRIIPLIPSLALALYLPWLELVIGGALLTGYAKQGASLVSAFLMSTFAVAVFSAWLRGLNISCGCFGSHESSSLGPVLIRDFALSATALTHAFLERKCYNQN